MRRLAALVIAAAALCVACVPGVQSGTTCYVVEINLGDGPGWNTLCRAPGAQPPPEFVASFIVP